MASPTFTAGSHAVEPQAELHNHAGAVEGSAQDEQGTDGHGCRVAETGQQVRSGKDSGQQQRSGAAEGNQLHGPASSHQQGKHGDQYNTDKIRRPVRQQRHGCSGSIRRNCADANPCRAALASPDEPVTTRMIH